MRGATWAATALAAALIAAPAAAHEQGGASFAGEHPGWYTPSPESSSGSLSIVAGVERTRHDSAYRNSDLAFWGDRAYAGHYDGFQILDIADPREPARLIDFACPGSQHDVSVWENRLLFVSVESPRSSPECDSVTQSPGFEGIRIFDVSDPATPRLIKGVATDCGSHTHTLVPDEANGRVLLYVASYTASVIARSEFGNECARFDEQGNRAHNKISVVEVPLDDPRSAAVVSEPRIPQNDFRVPGRLGCHDITVFMRIRKAAAACQGEGQIWDISDLEQPRTIARIHNPDVEFWHSAAFSWDGRTVVFGDEAGGGTRPRCRAEDPETLGALWFYDVAALDTMDASTVEPPLSHWKVPRIQGDAANCTMHNFNVLPHPSRDVLVSSAYAAGTTVVDFTDPRAPREIAHLDPHGANTWSSYWYDGFIFTNDGGRGVDVMHLADTRATAGVKRLGRSNPQTMEALQGAGAGGPGS